jgi:hypothetical protein
MSKLNPKPVQNKKYKQVKKIARFEFLVIKNPDSGSPKSLDPDPDQ